MSFIFGLFSLGRRKIWTWQKKHVFILATCPTKALIALPTFTLIVHESRAQATMQNPICLLLQAIWRGITKWFATKRPPMTHDGPMMIHVFLL